MNDEYLSSNAPQRLQSTCNHEQDRCVSNEVAGPIDTNKIRQINIEEVNRGFIVRVGCHTFAIGTKAELIDKLTEYINSPNSTERRWINGTLF